MKPILSYNKFRSLKAILLDDKYNFANFDKDKRFVINNNLIFNQFIFDIDKKSLNRINTIFSIFLLKSTEIQECINKIFWNGGNYKFNIIINFFANPNLPLYLITNCNEKTIDNLISIIKKIYKCNEINLIIKTIENSKPKDPVVIAGQEFILSFLKNLG